MAYEKKEGEVSLFENDKQGNDKRPDLKGTALIDGKEYEIALWKRESAKGMKFLAGSIKKIDETRKPEQKKEEVKREEVKMEDDEIPFNEA